MFERVKSYCWIVEALNKVEKCYYDANNERTFQSELYHQLRTLQDSAMNDYKLMCEVEKVKKILRKRKRPDMIFHIPNHPQNEISIELKRNANWKRLRKDLETLKCLKESPLQYKHGFLINIGRIRKNLMESLKKSVENWMDEYLHIIEIYWEKENLKIIHYWCQQGKILHTTERAAV